MIRASPTAFDLQGHRGARGLRPENTMVGFRHAVALGVTTLEMDLGMTADGVVVVTHDRRLNPDITRDSAGRWLKPPCATIESLTLAEVQALDVGRIDPTSAYCARFPDQQPADGERIPTLAEVLVATQALRPGVRYNIEIKTSPEHPEETASPEAFACAVVATVRAARLSSIVTIQSFDWRALLAVHRLAPEIATSALTVEGVGSNLGREWLGPAGLETAAPPLLAVAASCRIWSPSFRDLSAGAIEMAKALDLAVIPWTVNEPDEIATVCVLGVDGLITDYPNRAQNVLAALALPIAHGDT